MIHTKTHIYNIPSGVPFAECLARGMIESYGNNPEILAKTTVFLPSKQAITLVKDAFFTVNKGKILLLPKMRVLGELSEEELVLLPNNPHVHFKILSEKRPISNTLKTPALAKLILNTPHLFPHITHYADAVSVAQNILDLLDLLYTHNMSVDVLTTLDAENYSENWQKTLDNIIPITALWHDYLSQNGYGDPAHYRNIAFEYLTDFYTHNPPQNPVIVAGITDALPVCVAFLKIIQRLEHGHIIISGLDTHLTQTDILKLNPDHPQYALQKLLHTLGMASSDVPYWHASKQFLTNTHTQRQKLCTEIMRPSGTTEEWCSVNDRLSEQDMLVALDDINIIQAPNDRLEATAIALIIREAVENPHTKIALMTPNRELVARVTTILNRWNIKPTDTAGIALSQTPQGIYLKLLCDVLEHNFAPIPLLALLKHPMSNAGLPNGDFKKQVYLFEYHILRDSIVKNGLYGYGQALQTKINTLNPQSEHYTQRLDTYNIIVDMLAYLSNRFSDVLHAPDTVTMAALIPILKDLVSEMTCTDTQSVPESAPKSVTEIFWADDAGQKCLDMLDTYIQNSDLLGAMPKATACTYIIDSLSQYSVRDSGYNQNPNVLIWGTADARLQQADIIIMGGLTEGTFPVSPKTGVWLSRPMLAQMSLSLPEAKIGTDAYDFVQAFCTHKIFLTHCVQSNGSPTIPSRWLIRLENLLKSTVKNPKITDKLYNSPYLAWVDMLDNVHAKAKPASRPAPKPPAHARPTSMSVTDAEKWIRDPYSIYGKYILTLRKLNDIDQDLEAAEKGNIVHTLLHEFTLATKDGFGGKPHQIMRDLLDKTLETLKEKPLLYVFWGTRLHYIGMQFVDFEIDRRKTLTPIMYEQTGTLSFETSRGNFILKARCDRIDLNEFSEAILVDYKTSSGSATTYEKIKAGFAPQLPLQAMMLKQGGFGTAYPIAGAEYIVVADNIDIKPMKAKKNTDIEPLFSDLVDDIFNQFKEWTENFNDENTPYISRRLPEFLKFTGDYDLLARVPEWNLSDADDTDDEDDDEISDEG
jgi:ATP-dependent helicase/nuclease subunit B